MFGFKSKHVFGDRFAQLALKAADGLVKCRATKDMRFTLFCDRQNLQLVVKLYNWVTPPEFSHISGKNALKMQPKCIIHAALI